MHRTYELHGRAQDERRRLKVVTCREHEIVRHAQDMLEGEDLDQVVREGGRALFTVIK